MSGGILPNDIAAFRERERYTPDDGPPLGDPHLNAAINEHVQRNASENQRLELGLILTEVPGLQDAIRFEIDRAFATDNTRATYRSDFRKFRDWCVDAELPSLPSNAETMAHFIVENAEGIRPRSLERIVNAVAFMHSLKDISFCTDHYFIRGALLWAKRLHEANNAAAEEAEPKPAETPKTNGVKPH